MVILLVNFWLSVTIAELWRPELARRYIFKEIFAFKKNDYLR